MTNIDQNEVLNNHLYEMLGHFYGKNQEYDDATINYNLGLTTADLIQQILLFDKVVVKIYDVVYPLAYLINELGVSALRDFLEFDPIKFIVWTPRFFYAAENQPKTLKDGDLFWPAVLAGNREWSISLDRIFDDSLKFVSRQLSKDDENYFKTYFITNTTILDVESGHYAVNQAKELYKSNLLSSFDISFNEDYTIDYTPQEVRDIVSITMELFTAQVLIEKGIKGYNFYFLPKLEKAISTKINSAEKIINNNSRLFEINNIPDFKVLYFNKQLSLQRALRFANEKVSLKYKNWLSTTTDRKESNEISKEYLNAVVNKKGFFETTRGKFTKTVGFWGINAVVGGITAGVPGAIAGAGMANLTEKTFDLSLGFFESFYFDKLTKQWNPKIYFDKLDKLLE
jgi:hypothetical protein